MPIDGIKALTFDVFGTVVDWRGSIIREGADWERSKGLTLDWARFADAWRARYQPGLDRVRTGLVPWTKLDDLHRASLNELLVEFDIRGLAEAEIDHMNRVWHRLNPWPDTVPGLTRLKTKFILCPLSNGNVSLLVDMAKHAGLPWDAVLGAEVARHYKPQPECYLTTAGLLGLQAEECMMVAAHNSDLIAASGLGFRTGFVGRPAEYGPEQKTNLSAEREFDVIAGSFIELAERLGC